MKVAIIGGGAAGLCAGRHCKKHNLQFDVYEQTGHVGGTWNYTEDVGFDSDGLPVHTSMYKNLRTNLPKELMSFEDYPYPKEQTKSYIERHQVLDYLNKFAQNFHLEPHINFYTRVVKISRKNNDWVIVAENTKLKTQTEAKYDAVIICNGHFSIPIVPHFDGFDTFTGNASHSHDYRSPDRYIDKRLLVIGGGPSGVDISMQITPVAKKVIASIKSDRFKAESIELIKKGLVVKFNANRVLFDDGTDEEVDEVLFCTGYSFSFPFFDNDGNGVTVIDQKRVYPLYKHVINVENPTMAFIGLPFSVCPFPTFDIQVRFFLSTLTGHYVLPPRAQMLKEVDEDLASCGRPPHKYHELGEGQGAYFAHLAESARIRPIPAVINRLYRRVRTHRNLNDRFRILDDDNWEQIS